MKNKIYIGLGIILFGVVTSYIAFSWSEPTSMPSDYDVPINTSNKPQDVAEGKPVVGNLDAEKLGGYTASDILNLIGGRATYQIVEGTTCPPGTILTSKYYEEKTCDGGFSYFCEQATDEEGNYIEGCEKVRRWWNFTIGGSWGVDSPSEIRHETSDADCEPAHTSSNEFYCERVTKDYWTQRYTCEDPPITHVLCLTISDPE